jgi:hypothetical protein
MPVRSRLWRMGWRLRDRFRLRRLRVESYRRAAPRRPTIPSRRCRDLRVGQGPEAESDVNALGHQVLPEVVEKKVDLQIRMLVEEFWEMRDDLPYGEARADADARRRPRSSVVPRTACSASSSSARTASMRARKSETASVSVTARVLRTRRGAPTLRSSSAMVREAVDCGMSSSRPAAEKLPLRATRANSLSAKR